MNANIFNSIRLVLGLTLVCGAGAGCKTAVQGERPVAVTVIGLSGDARYFLEHDETPHAIKLGMRLPPGATIQTASGEMNGVCLVFGERGVGSGVTKLSRADKITLWENTVLKLEIVTAKTVAGKEITDTRLLLIAGSVTANAGRVWPHGPINSLGKAGPKVTLLKPQADTSYYEIRSSNTVVHVEHGTFLFRASGITSVNDGSVAVEFLDSSMIKDLFAPQIFDPTTGATTEIQPPRFDEGYSYPVWDWAEKPWKVPPPEMMQRPF